MRTKDGRERARQLETAAMAQNRRHRPPTNHPCGEAESGAPRACAFCQLDTSKKK
jgi:hypothetical protein